jgi:hypothetical protein
MLLSFWLRSGPLGGLGIDTVGLDAILAEKL